MRRVEEDMGVPQAPPELHTQGSSDARTPHCTARSKAIKKNSTKKTCVLRTTIEQKQKA